MGLSLALLLCAPLFLCRAHRVACFAQVHVFLFQFQTIVLLFRSNLEQDEHDIATRFHDSQVKLSGIATASAESPNVQNTEPNNCAVET